MNTLSGQTVLLTGATGFIGSRLLDHLRQKTAARLIVISRNAPISQKENEVWVTGDLDQFTRQKWLDHGVDKIDLVFHLGAYTPKRSSGGDAIDEIYRSNLLGTRALLEGLPNVPRKLILASTLDVYALPPEGHVLTESSPLSPPSLYGASKLFCEHLIHAFARQHSCGYAILRYGHIYGPGEDAYLKLIPVSIRALLRNDSPVVYGDGSVLRDFLYVDDAVEATIRASVATLERIDPVNIVSGKSRPVREIVEILVALNGIAGRQVEYLLDKPGGQSLRFSSNRMAEILGSWEKVPLEEGLRREFDYFKKMGLMNAKAT